jgi:uncharacterized membrane protein (UPF0182 family)
MLVLPVDNTFLYVQPIFLQATQARMPQLKKVVLAMSNRLIYADSYEQALAQLSAGGSAGSPTPQQQPSPAAVSATPATVSVNPPALDSIRAHLRRYRELQGQGRWSDAGKELEAIEAELKK